MKVIFMGTPEFAVGTLRSIVDKGHEVVACITQPDRNRGKGKGVSFSPVKEAALEYGITVYQPERLRNDSELIEHLKGLGADIGVVIAYGQILPQEVLDIPRLGCLNVHASLLPAYRGAAPIEWSILDGMDKTGVTIMQMDAGLDTGDMLARKAIAIESDETGGSLHDKLAALGAELLADTLDEIAAGNVTPIKQGDTTTHYASMLNKQMGLINWDEPAELTERKIRALNPWPSAYTKLNNKTVKIWKAQVTDECADLEPGTITADKSKMIVTTGAGSLSVLELQMEGKKRMAVADFLRGAGPDTLKHFDRISE